MSLDLEQMPEAAQNAVSGPVLVSGWTREAWEAEARNARIQAAKWDGIRMSAEIALLAFERPGIKIKQE